MVQHPSIPHGPGKAKTSGPGSHVSAAVRSHVRRRCNLLGSRQDNAISGSEARPSLDGGALLRLYWVMTQACPPQIYRRRRPELSVLYRALAHHFERFEQVYEERFEPAFGFLRKVVRESVFRFLDCGILERGTCRWGRFRGALLQPIRPTEALVSGGRRDRYNAACTRGGRVFLSVDMRLALWGQLGGVLRRPRFGEASTTEDRRD